MAPPWVLLDRCVDFCFDAEDDDSAAAVVAAAKNKVSVAKASVLQALTESTVALLGSMKPDAVLPHPPGISTLRLLGSKSHRAVPSSSLVACADKGLLVLYAGMYCGPGSPTRGCYLVYDASAGAPVLLTTVPPPPVARYLTCIGSGAVVLRRHTPSSAYLLAELATTRERGLPDAVLYLRRSDSPTPQWVKKEVQLPPEVRRAPGNHNFCADLSFSALDSLCWVDLLRGIVVCHDPWGPQDPVFSFIPLPDGCPSVGTSDHPYRPRMLEFRSAACVGGAIKVVTMEGYLEDLYFHQFRLTTWTLSPDVREWRQDGVFPLKNLWMTDEYRALKLPQHTPVCPVLSAREEAVVYVVVNDVEHVELREMVQGSQAVRTQIDFKGQYVLGLDMHHNKIISTSHGLPASMMQLTPRLIATEFCASLQGIKDRQREVEAREDGESGKKPRVD